MSIIIYICIEIIYIRIEIIYIRIYIRIYISECNYFRKRYSIVMYNIIIYIYIYTVIAVDAAVCRLLILRYL